MQLRYDLLPKSDRLKIRAEMIDEMMRTFAHDGAPGTLLERRIAATKIVNQALSRERAKQAKEIQHVN